MAREPNLPHNKEPASCGTTTFIGLRLLDIPIQFGILHYDIGSHVLHRLQPSTHNAAIHVNRLVMNPSPARDLPITRLILLAMATGSTLKHIFWATSLNHETMDGKSALAIGVTNMVVNSINTLLFTTSLTCPMLTSQDCAAPNLVVGSALYVLGMIIETGAECQRKRFQRDSRNAGKLCTEGFWNVVRHPNYIGDAMWRAGFALAAGGWKWAAVTGAFTLGDFALRASKGLEDHLSQKYQARWMHYVEEVPYKLIPGVL